MMASFYTIAPALGICRLIHDTVSMFSWFTDSFFFSKTSLVSLQI